MWLNLGDYVNDRYVVAEIIKPLSSAVWAKVRNVELEIKAMSNGSGSKEELLKSIKKMDTGTGIDGSEAGFEVIRD